MSLASDVFGVYQKRFTSYSSFIGDCFLQSYLMHSLCFTPFLNNVICLFLKVSITILV